MWTSGAEHLRQMKNELQRLWGGQAHGKLEKQQGSWSGVSKVGIQEAVSTHTEMNPPSSPSEYDWL